MTHKKDFGANAQTVNQQTPLEENVKKQADLIANGSKRQRLKHLIIGSPEAVRSAIHYFHSMGHSEAGDWSPLQPDPQNPEEFISILVRKVTLQ